MIILQDVSVDGYVTEKKPQNLDTTTKVLKKLAKFHALSFFLEDGHEDKISSYTEPFFVGAHEGQLGIHQSNGRSGSRGAQDLGKGDGAHR